MANESKPKKSLFEEHPIIAVLVIFMIIAIVFLIFVIIMVGGVFYYYGVSSPEKMVGESKIGFSRIEVDSWNVIPGNPGKLDLVLENEFEKDVTITEIIVKLENEIKPNRGLNQGIEAGGKKELTVDTPSISHGDVYGFDVNIKYIREDYPEAEFSSSGRIRGQV